MQWNSFLIFWMLDNYKITQHIYIVKSYKIYDDNGIGFMIILHFEVAGACLLMFTNRWMMGMMCWQTLSLQVSLTYGVTCDGDHFTLLRICKVSSFLFTLRERFVNILCNCYWKSIVWQLWIIAAPAGSMESIMEEVVALLHFLLDKMDGTQRWVSWS